ncbi:hypothetical protein Unana1_08795 [Umbelopsis nana]
MSSAAVQNPWKNLYHYDPIIGVAIAAAALYTIAFIIVVWQTRKYKMRHPSSIHSNCAISATTTIGVGRRKLPNVGAFVRAAPDLNFETEVEITNSHQPCLHSRMRVSGIKTGKKLIRTIENAFLYLDILAFFTQAAGSGMLVIQSMANTGNKIAIAGMAISVANFVIFAGAIFYIHQATRRESPEYYNANLRPVFLALYINIICLIIRSIYRLVEFADGFFGYVNTHEVFFLVFDTLLILICVVTWIIFPAGKYLQNRSGMQSPETVVDYYNLEDQKA